MEKDFRAITETLVPGADYNPACYDFNEEEARVKQLWRDDRPMPTQQEIDDCWAIIEPLLVSDKENDTQTWIDYLGTV